MKQGALGAETVIKDETVGKTRIKTYVTTLTIQTSAGPVQDFVICRHEKYLGAPPPSLPR